jgi:hypothetical protein
MPSRFLPQSRVTAGERRRGPLSEKSSPPGPLKKLPIINQYIGKHPENVMSNGVMALGVFFIGLFNRIQGQRIYMQLQNMHAFIGTKKSMAMSYSCVESV